jgi:hypothetical protein
LSDEREGVYLGVPCTTPDCEQSARHWIEWISILDLQAHLAPFCTSCRNVILRADESADVGGGTIH